MLDFDLFRRVIDEAGPSLGRIDFFNYGEAFLHKRAVEMCEYIKANFPHIYLYTSTNGLRPFPAQATYGSYRIERRCRCSSSITSSAQQKTNQPAVFRSRYFASSSRARIHSLDAA
jgi:hypothetical protein